MKPPNFCYAGSNCHGLSRGQPLRARNRYIRRGRRPRRPAKTTEYLPSIIVGNAFMHSASQHANGTDKSVPYSYRICATKECRDTPPGVSGSTICGCGFADTPGGVSLRMPHRFCRESGCNGRLITAPAFSGGLQTKHIGAFANRLQFVICNL